MHDWQQLSRTLSARASIRSVETPASSRIARAISPSVRPAVAIRVRIRPASIPCTSLSAARIASPTGCVVPSRSVPSMSNSTSTGSSLSSVSVGRDQHLRAAADDLLHLLLMPVAGISEQYLDRV
jgi:hypothetical protein